MNTESTAVELLHVWALCLRASEEARRRGDRRTGTDHIVLALLDDPSTAAALGVNLQQARQALDSLDNDALGSLGIGSVTAIPPLAVLAVPKQPRFRDVAQKDRFRLTPAAKKVLEEATKPNRRRLEVTARQVMLQILSLQPPDPAAELLDALDVDRSDVRRRLASKSPSL